jgi:D-3-phosphoglycerate dehydrogenase
VNPPAIFVSESSRFSPDALRLLESLGRVELADVQNRAELLTKVSRADILWVRLRHRIDAEVMDAAPRLRAIATATTGLNHIDLDETKHRNIRVISLRDHTDFLRDIYATAEHTMALIFALIRQVPAATRHVTDGGWNRDLFVGRELHGKKAGIVGYGRVGRMVARQLAAFGMHVVAADPALQAKSAETETEDGVEVASLETLLATSDLVTLHVNFNEKTRGFFGASQFALMKPNAWFVNTSRGELVDEAALLGALRRGRIAGAALDVLSSEDSSGMAANPLVQYARDHHNLLITPHIGGCTVESTAKTEIFIAQQIAAFLQPQPEEACVAANRKDRS